MRLHDLFEHDSIGSISPPLITRKLINERISHPEDLLFDHGSSGAKSAIKDLARLEKESDTITIKWDGMPAVVFGRDDTGKLHVLDKHMYDKISKGRMDFISIKDYDQQRGADRNDLWAKADLLERELERLVPANRNVFYFGDLLWTGNQTASDGVYKITPNTVTYQIKEDSELGRKISNSVAGIAVHSIFPGLGQSDQPLKGIGDLPSDGRVVFLSGEMKERPRIKINDEDVKVAKKIVDENSKIVDEFISSLKANKLASVLSAMQTFITHKLRIESEKDGEKGFSKMADDFMVYLPKKLKSPAKERAVSYLGSSDGAKGLAAFWNTWLAVTYLKKSIKDQIDAMMNDPSLDVRATINDDPGHEGYVVGSGFEKLKLVDRLGFSAANFAKTRTDPRELAKRAKMPLAAFCFGRMNPPTLGHKKLMDVTSNIGGENSFIFLSPKQGAPTDPLDHATKVAFAKRMFPEHAPRIVDEPVLNPIHAANYLYDRGFRNMVFVAGSDRLGDGENSIESTLRNWNSGPIRTADAARGPQGREEVVLRFRSSGDRDPESTDISGYSGTKARDAARSGNEKLFYQMTGAKSNIMIDNKNLYDMVRAKMGVKEGNIVESVEINARGHKETHKNGTIALLRLSKQSAEELKEWCDLNDIPCNDPKKLHCTVLFSQNPVEHLSWLNGAKLKVHARIKGWKKLGNALTLELYAPKAHRLHKWMRKQGGTHGYPEYIAHTTTSYDWPSDDLPDKLPKFFLEFDSLTVEEIDPKYSDD